MQEEAALDRLFEARSLAIVGASADPSKPGGRLMNYAIRFSPDLAIYPINPNRTEVMGKQSYPKVTEVPGDVDVACVVVPGQNVQAVVKDCAEKGVRYIVILSSGFAEVGEKRLQESLVETARKSGCRVVGPNCQGVVSTGGKLVASYHSSLDLDPVRGGVSIVAQSGALGGYICSNLWSRGVGTNHFVSTGNESDLEAADFLEYLVSDRTTSLVAMFLEGVRNGRRFREAAESALLAKKPVLVLKTGRSDEGRKSAMTHTGALAGTDSVYDALFRQVGIVRVRTLEELTDGILGFAWQPIPSGNRVAFISPSGAACALVSDLCEGLGLEVAGLSEPTLARVRSIIPSVALAKNPLDVVYLYGNPNARTMMGDLIEAMALDPSVDVVVSGLTISTSFGMEVMEFVFQVVNRLRQRVSKPILFWWATDDASFKSVEKVFSEQRVPIYPTPERSVVAAELMCRYGGFLKSKQNR